MFRISYIKVLVDVTNIYMSHQVMCFFAFLELIILLHEASLLSLSFKITLFSHYSLIFFPNPPNSIPFLYPLNFVFSF